MATYKNIDDLEVYRLAMTLGQEVWDLSQTFPESFDRAVGWQLTRAADSIAANISEGFGRYHYRDNARFCYMARGSLQECRTWLSKAYSRGFVSETQHSELQDKMLQLAKLLNGYTRALLRHSKRG